MIKRLSVTLCLLLPLVAAAEDDGNEFLAFMRKAESREAAMAYVEAARAEWNMRLFCIEGGDVQAKAFDAVKQYLEANPDQLYRPRRYLIIQGLRSGYPCGNS